VPVVYWQSDPVMEVEYRLKYGYSVNYSHKTKTVVIVEMKIHQKYKVMVGTL
jgi:hypothetical protein